MLRYTRAALLMKRYALTLGTMEAPMRFTLAPMARQDGLYGSKVMMQSNYARHLMARNRSGQIKQRATYGFTLLPPTYKESCYVDCIAKLNPMAWR